MPAAARRSSTVTPCHSVSNFDHVVTQWMSVVTRVCGSALNSSQVQVLTGRGPTLSVKRQSARSTKGEGP